MRNIQEVFERYNFNVEKDVEVDGFWISQFTPAGEDWGFSLNKLEDIKEYANDFDVDEEFEIWVQAKINGVKGVPSYSELYQDQIWKQNILKNVANEI